MKLPNNLLSKTSFLLSKCALLVTQALEKELEQFDIKTKHYAVMLLLNETSDINQKEIGKTLFIDRNTMVLVVDSLEALKYLKRVKSRSDRRAYNLILTRKGKSILREATKVVNTVEENHLKSLNKKEIENLNAMLMNFIASNSTVNT